MADASPTSGASPTPNTTSTPHGPNHDQPHTSQNLDSNPSTPSNAAALGEGPNVDSLGSGNVYSENLESLRRYAHAGLDLVVYQADPSVPRVPGVIAPWTDLSSLLSFFLMKRVEVNALIKDVLMREYQDTEADVQSYLNTDPRLIDKLTVAFMEHAMERYVRTSFPGSATLQPLPFTPLTISTETDCSISTEPANPSDEPQDIDVDGIPGIFRFRPCRRDVPRWAIYNPKVCISHATTKQCLIQTPHMHFDSALQRSIPSYELIPALQAPLWTLNFCFAFSHANAFEYVWTLLSAPEDLDWPLPDSPGPPPTFDSLFIPKFLGEGRCFGLLTYVPRGSSEIYYHFVEAQDNRPALHALLDGGALHAYPPNTFTGEWWESDAGNGGDDGFTIQHEFDALQSGQIGLRNIDDTWNSLFFLINAEYKQWRSRHHAREKSVPTQLDPGDAESVVAEETGELKETKSKEKIQWTKELSVETLTRKDPEEKDREREDEGMENQEMEDREVEDRETENQETKNQETEHQETENQEDQDTGDQKEDSDKENQEPENQEMENQDTGDQKEEHPEQEIQDQAAQEPAAQTDDALKQARQEPAAQEQAPQEHAPQEPADQTQADQTPAAQTHDTQTHDAQKQSRQEPDDPESELAIAMRIKRRKTDTAPAPPPPPPPPQFE